MNCPLCIDQTLEITYHSGIEIDVCPRCRGIWLDRGELEKLAEAKPAPKAAKPVKQPSSKDGSGSGKSKSSKSKKKRKKKKSLGSRLGDVLEDVLDL